MIRSSVQVRSAPRPDGAAAGRLLLGGALMFGALISALAPAAQSTSDHTDPQQTSRHQPVVTTGRR